MISNPEQLFKTLSHGVYVIGVKDSDRQNAFTAAWVMQVSFDPMLLAISINPTHYSYQILKQGRVCSVNVLSRHQSAIAEHFGRTAKDKMSGFSWQTDATGAPILRESQAYFDCELSHFTDAGDHQIAVVKVVAGAVLNAGSPLLYNQTGDMDRSREFYSQSS